MKVLDLSKKISANIIAGEDGIENRVTGGYICDLLSWVIGKAKMGDCWITVMGNINSIAVATLSDISCIILAENATLDADAKVKADLYDIPILSSPKSAYTLALELGESLK